MPLLKDLNCSIELSGDQGSLQELGTVYGDAVVETFIAVPKKQQTFTIHLSSRNFIAPGIAMYVFIDGVYQCNRNRQGMKLRRPPDRRSLVDFRVRQKEERQRDGSMIAREWTFEKLDQSSADGAPDSCSPNILENIGCIEVVVLRCAGTRNAKTAANMNLDGAADYPGYRFDRDKGSRSIAYDDRVPFDNSNVDRYGSPQPGLLYRSPYAAGSRLRGHTQKGPSLYSAPLSPGTRPHRDIPAPAFQYGSGPLPPYSRADAQTGLMGGAMPDIASRSVPTVDPGMLEKIVADAVKRGVEESRKTDRFGERHEADSSPYHEDMKSSSQIPGAWPSPTRRQSQQPSHSTRKRRSSRSRVGTRVAWDEDSEWDKQSQLNGWNSRLGKDDPWDTDETWSGKPPEGWDEIRRRSKSKSRIVHEPSVRQSSHVTDRASRRHRRSKYGSSRRWQSRPRSQWLNGARSPLGDGDLLTSSHSPSDSSTSLEHSDSTLKPSHSRSQTQYSKKKAARRSSGHDRSSPEPDRRLSNLFEPQQWQPHTYRTQSPSMLVTNAPNMVSAPISQYPRDAHVRKPSVYTPAPMAAAAPPPTWGCASEKLRKNSTATTYLPPAPFSVVGGEGRESQQPSGSSSWNITDEKATKNKTNKKVIRQGSSWGEDKKETAKSIWADTDKAADWNQDQKQGWGANSDGELKNDDWGSSEKGNDGWESSHDAQEAMAGAWDDTKINDGWGETAAEKVVVGRWDTDNNESDWEVDNAHDVDQNDSAAFKNENPWGATQETNTAWNQPLDATTNNDALNAKAGNIWTAAPVAAEKPNGSTNPPFPSNRHASKSLSKYRQLSTPPSTKKPHRQFPPPPPKTTLRPTLSPSRSNSTTADTHPPRIATVPAEPLYKIPSSAAEEKKDIEHQVLAGQGTAYGHAVSRPVYVDSLEKPYAVFRFKYRGWRVLRGMFGGRSEEEEVEGLSEEEVVRRRMVGLRVEGVGEGDAGSKRGFTEEWVCGQSRGGVEWGGENRGGAKKAFGMEKVQW